MLRSILTLAALVLPPSVAAQLGREDGGDEDVWTALSARYDTNQDGRIDAEEYPRGDEKFRRLDRDNDGSITETDFETRGRRRGGPDIRRRMAGRIVSAADTDESGDVTSEEWTSFLASLEADKDGVVETEKLQGVLERGARGGRPERTQPRGGDLGARRLQMFDRDGDEQIEITDLKAIFAEVDGDGSGVIEAGEMRMRRGGGGRGSASGDSVPQPGSIAPDFELPYAKNEDTTVRLSSFAGKRPVALVFGSYT